MWDRSKRKKQKTLKKVFNYSHWARAGLLISLINLIIGDGWIWFHPMGFIKILKSNLWKLSFFLSVWPPPAKHSNFQGIDLLINNLYAMTIISLNSFLIVNSNCVTSFVNEDLTTRMGWGRLTQQTHQEIGWLIYVLDLTASIQSFSNSFFFLLYSWSVPFYHNHFSLPT